MPTEGADTSHSNTRSIKTAKTPSCAPPAARRAPIPRCRGGSGAPKSTSCAPCARQSSGAHQHARHQ